MIACARFRRVPSLGGEVKSMVVGSSHGEVRVLINIPFEIVFHDRLDTHGRVDSSNMIVW